MFIVIGVFGAVLLVSSLLFDDVIDGLVPDLDFISGPVIGAFLAALGLFGWYAGAGLDSGTLVAAAIGAGGGAVFGWFTYRVTKALTDQPTDATPRAETLVGVSGRVVTAVRANGIGEVLVPLGGAPTKVTATADVDLPTGTPVVVVALESPTKVRVQAESDFWN